MKFLLLLFVSITTWGQMTLVAGSAGDIYHTPTNLCLFSGAVARNPPCVTNYSDVTMSPATLFYGYSALPFTYTLPAPNGTCDLTLTFIEPNKTGPGQRVFTATVQGTTTPPIDIWAHAGLKKPYVMSFPGVKVTAGSITVTFQPVNPVTGNPVVSILSISNCVPVKYLQITIAPDGTIVVNGSVHITGELSNDIP